MWSADEWRDYELLDCSDGERLERWGKRVFIRPDPQVIWHTPRRQELTPVIFDPRPAADIGNITSRPAKKIKINIKKNIKINIKRAGRCAIKI